MNNTFVKSKKYIVIALFIAAAVLSVMLMGKVTINYNVSDYLDENTETKISLHIIEDEFGMTGDVQVMIEDIDAATANSVRDTLKDIPNVLTVQFNEYDEGYFKDGTALFVVIVDGDEYSEVAATVVEDMKAALDETFDGKTSYGGAVIEKANLREAIEGEIPVIMGISLCLVVAIMLLTSKSWLEPFILLLASGVAILLNMGTNAVFGQISYITNAVAAILQLALSIDYSIVLLHGYRRRKEAEPDKHKAMAGAIKDVLRPVSASALTTIAGLLALLFMSFKIGFDIGMVLMKGILLSAITSLTLLPALLLLLDRIMVKTKKRELVLKGGIFCRMSFKAGKAVVPLAIILIIACGVLQLGNAYAFTESSIANGSITNTFGQNNTIVVVYPNSGDNHGKEISLVGKLNAYTTADGRPVLKNHTAYSNTVRELYDVELAAQKLHISESDVELLLTMYHLYESSEQVKLTPIDFMKYADTLIREDPDAQSFTDEQTTKIIRTMLVIDTIMNGEHTAEDFHTLATTGVMAGTEMDLFAIKQMYGLYFYDQVENAKVSLKDIIAFASAQAAGGNLGDLIDEGAKESLAALADRLDEFEAQMNEPMTKAEFREYMLSDHGVALDASTIDLLYASYFANQEGVAENTIPLMDLLNFLVDMGQITDADAIAGIQQLNELYLLDVAAFRAQMDQLMNPTEFHSYLQNELGVSIGSLEVVFLFIQYGSVHDTPGQDHLPFLPLMTFLVTEGYVTDPDSVARIEMLNQLYDTDLEGMQAQLHTAMTMDQFREYMLTEHGTSLDDATLDILYGAYFGYEADVVGDSIPFLSLMNYLIEKGQVSDSDAIATIQACNTLLAVIPEAYAYDELLDAFGDSLEVLAGQPVELGFADSAIQQIYIMYFYEQNAIPVSPILGRDFIDFVSETLETNETVAAQLSADDKAKIADLCLADEFLSRTTPYDYKEMTEQLTDLQEGIQSLSVATTLGSDRISSIYIKYAINNKLGLAKAVEAKDLLDFVVANMDTNELLGKKMSAEHRAKVTAAQADIAGANALFLGENYSRMLLSVDLPVEGEEAGKFLEFLTGAVKDTFGEGAHIAGRMVSTYDLQVAFDKDNTFITVFTIIAIFAIIMLIFRSLSLPVVLVTVIQGAIWISMSTSLITGPMFFMSYIVTTCILMGATIDYGILMSTSYMQYRQTLDKKEALYKAVEAAMPTVFTSGIILTICGFVVGLISSQTSIATVGTLLGKGTLVSVLMITLVLPSILYLLDGFILKLSIRKKTAQSQIED